MENKNFWFCYLVAFTSTLLFLQNGYMFFLFFLPLEIQLFYTIQLYSGVN